MVQLNLDSEHGYQWRPLLLYLETPQAALCAAAVYADTGITIWSFFAVFEALAATVPLKILFSALTYLGIVSVPVFLLIFTLHYIGEGRKINLRSLCLLFMVPLATMLISATNGMHGLMWPEVTLDKSSFAGIYGIYSHGPWFWVNAAYSYLCIAAALAVLLIYIVKYKYLYQPQPRLLIFYSAIPWIANIIYVFFPSAIAGLEITPVFFTISALLLFLAIFHYRILDLSPVAWDNITDSLNEGVALFDAQNRLINFNRAFGSLFDLKKTVIAGLPNDFLGLHPEIKECVSRQKERCRCEICLDKNNQNMYLKLGCSPIYNKKGNQIMGSILVAHDITAERISGQKIRESEEKFRTLFDQSMDGIYIAAPQGEYVDVNTSLAKMLGYSGKAELIKKGLHKLFHFLDLQQSSRFETKLQKKDGSFIDVEISNKVVCKEGKSIYCQGMVRNVTRRKRLEKRLKYLSFHDALTGLYNRFYFQEETRRMDMGIERYAPISIISMDINDLKKVNDLYGHLQGDLLIKQTAVMLRSLLRKTDILARIGGDEFCAILPRTREQTAEKRRNKLLKAIDLYNDESKNMNINIAMGIASTRTGEISINTALRRADRDMYIQKKKMK